MQRWSSESRRLWTATLANLRKYAKTVEKEQIRETSRVNLQTSFFLQALKSPLKYAELAPDQLTGAECHVALLAYQLGRRDAALDYWKESLLSENRRREKERRSDAQQTRQKSDARYHQYAIAFWERAGTGRGDPLKDTAKAFGVSTRTIQRAVKRHLQ